MLLYIDSFDHYTDVSKKGWVVVNYGGVTTGRNGNGGYVGANWSAGNNGTISRPVTSSAEIVIGCAMNMGDICFTPYWDLREGGTTHLQMTRNGSGQLEFRRGGTLLGTTTFVAAASTWFHLDLRLKVHDTTGTLEVKINGVSQFTFSGDTRNGGAAGAIDTILWGANTVFACIGQHNWYFDDLYVCDVTGSVNNDFLGDCKVECLFPNGNGNSSQFDGSDGNTTDNYLLVDETAPDDDTTYVESSDVGDKDTYAYGNLVTVAGEVKGVQAVPYAKKNDAGPVRSIVSVARTSGSETDSTDKVMTGAYLYYPDIRETKPGGGAWTIADVNASEFGVKVTA